MGEKLSGGKGNGDLAESKGYRGRSARKGYGDVGESAQVRDANHFSHLRMAWWIILVQILLQFLVDWRCSTFFCGVELIFCVVKWSIWKCLDKKRWSGETKWWRGELPNRPLVL